jgi:hypothetical protein
MSKAMEVYEANVGNTHTAAVEAVFVAGVAEGKASVMISVTNDFVSVPKEPVVTTKVKK